ncbi:MAG: MFS transporter, partial [Cytophagaceae bacterium]
ATGAGKVTDHYLVAARHDWTSIWLFPTIFALLVFFCFSLAFRRAEVEA